MPNYTLKPGTKIHDPLAGLGNWAAQQAGNVRRAFTSGLGTAADWLNKEGIGTTPRSTNYGRTSNDYRGPAYGNPSVVPGRVGGGNAGASTASQWASYPSSQTLFNTAPGAQTPIVIGANSRGEVDRTQSDMYKQYALNPQGQFNRYFQSPEMDQYFGAASRGQGAPGTLEAMNALAGQQTAQGAPSLATYYRSQSAAGRGNMDEIVGALGYKGTPMEKWAQENPMLAMREFNKKFPAGEPTQGPSDDAIRAAMQSGQFYPAEGSPQPQFGTPANSVPAPPQQQIAAATAPFSQAIGMTKWNITPDGQMPQFPVNSDLPVRDKVQRYLEGTWGDFLTPNKARA